MSDGEIKITASETNKKGKPFPQTPKPQIFVERFSVSSVSVHGDTKKSTRISISIGSVVIIAIAICVFFSFSNNIEKKIIGTWQVDEQPQIYVTFGENAAFSMSGDGDYLDGNYTFLSDNTVQVHMNYLWADFVLTGDISINGSVMTITNMSDPDDIFGADGVTLTLTKTK